MTQDPDTRISTQEPQATTPVQKLVIGVTFHFDGKRLGFLQRTAKNFAQLSQSTKVFVVTNTESPEEQKLIKEAVGTDTELVVPTHLGHPYLLTWGHFDRFRELFQADTSLSHFLYLEDDIEIKLDNLNYWLRAREELRSTGLIPSFLRYEVKEGEAEMRSTDVTSQFELKKLPKVQLKGREYCYINFPEPYQGMYFLDRELAQEHLFGESSSPDFGRWGIREKAAQGLTFAQVPKNCFSRNFVGFHRGTNSIDPRALIHHLPNNYANNPESKHGKIPIRELVI
jgi:hypothetical protein